MNILDNHADTQSSPSAFQRSARSIHVSLIIVSASRWARAVNKW